MSFLTIDTAYLRLQESERLGVMGTGRSLLGAVAAIVCCLALAWLSTSIKGSPKKYEVQPWITVPEYRTEAARAIDAYERLMDRYMDLTERNLFGVSSDIREVAKTLDSIDHRLTQLCARIARIEKTLGIEQPPDSIEGTSQSVPVDSKQGEESPAPAGTD